MNLDALSHDQYGLLFDIRRSVRYHDRRKAFYELLHHITSWMTILMAGSVLFDAAKDGKTADWMICLSIAAALLAAADMVLGYSRRANLHGDLRRRFADLEIAILMGGSSQEEWHEHTRTRLIIEKDEPAIYKVLDLLCRNELLVAEGFNRKDNPEQFANITRYQRWTCQLYRWDAWQAA
ncbi:hypothetical protein [Laribacter hongkongensis]|uniref:hypothetical protein n=1 Tax=Laribacter hongkongensis TaxID=168471 RepID=UPI001EFDBC09|nr:hypothetical protein [Laribacter hongkongensis]MCG8998423.1 hypothetical protein [Laribacter hongkongensis]MCG9013592.1 hypothetical protein [Laribacter hongkongensis]MCG9045104.1 hypothetical protein [Laribacter hongkongensis]